MKKILLIVTATLLIAYLVVASVGLCQKPAVGVCQGVELRVRDSLGYGLLDNEQVFQVLKRNGIALEGVDMSLIDTYHIEEILQQYPLIEQAQCYKTAGDLVKIKVLCRTPLFRVRSVDGSDYYVDAHGTVLEHSGLALNLPVVTGHVSRSMACSDIKTLVEIILANPFWRDQIEQIDITQNHEIQMVPRVGAHLLMLGDASNLQTKMERLYNFYEKGLSTIGWEKYTSISVAFEGQVVCRKH